MEYNGNISQTGAFYKGNNKCIFSLWAPFCKKISLKIAGPEERIISMEKNEHDMWKNFVDDIKPGDLYFYKLNDITERPDPASRFQPHGVHGPSMVIDQESFSWTDQSWKGLSLKKYIIYEMHIGTFTRKGTFEATIGSLDHLKTLGITAIEIMPVAQFPGERNWGYDGVYPFAPQNSYGGPEGLKKLINECHKKGIAVVLDVVYNHLGPEGNYLGDFGPYFTKKYKTPWGNAINLDGPYSDRVKEFFIANALYWITEFHVDSLRLDAIHGIFDFSARHFLTELAEAVHEKAKTLDRKIYVIAESDLNDTRVINPIHIGGYGLDGQWNDDFHHSLHSLLTGEKSGYYKDFGAMQHMSRAFGEGFVYSGQYSEFRKRRHGNSSKNIRPDKFVVFSQNHDQVGNRPRGDRLSSTECLEKLKLAGTVVLLSPFIPLIFMGEEYGETAPFKYFISHSDKDLIEAVRKGRQREFPSFKNKLSDPQAENTFLDSRINLSLSEKGNNKLLFKFYKELIILKKKLTRINIFSNRKIKTGYSDEKRFLYIVMYGKDYNILCIYSFNESPLNIKIPLTKGIWEKIIDSSSDKWGGSGEKASNIFNCNGDEIGVSLNSYNALVYLNKNKSGE